MLKQFAPGSELRLHWEEISLPEIKPPAAKVTLVEDSYEGDVEHKGHGLQRALIVTLLQELAITTGINEMDTATDDVADDQAHGTATDVIVDEQWSPDLIIAFEEPELYLHPSRCRYLADLLMKISENPLEGRGSSNQILYTTHSPYFVDLNRFDQLRVVRKGKGTTDEIPKTSVNSYSLEKAKKDLAVVNGTNPNDYTRESFKARASSVMNPVVSEGFFSDKVVVVEGMTEVCSLWKLQEILELGWIEKGIVIVPAGGKNNIDRPVIIFRGLKIPTYFIYDGDSQLKGRDRENARNRNQCYCRMAGIPTEDFPPTQVHGTWCNFSETIDGEIRADLDGEVYAEIKRQVADELGYDDPDRACKNSEGASRLVELIYERGFTLPTLEHVVQSITGD